MSPSSQRFSAMISSTALDLPEHRALVHQACLDAGVFPIGMEQLPARDATGIAASLEMVDQADLYLGIYAFRYGWVPDGKAISITEMEFDRAVARQAEGELREVLVFTAHESHAFTAKDVEAHAGAQESLRQFKSRAVSGRVRAEFKSAEELRRLVLHALNEFKHRQAAPLARSQEDPPLRSATPNNLPRLQPFFGRESELAVIREALDPESRTWGALIDGPGGMGKTSLAVRAAYDCPLGQFDRIVFVSVKTRELDDDGERSLGTFILPGFLEMLNELAAELGRPDIPKATEDQRIRLLLEALRPARILLLLDNLESLPKSDRDQLFTFVKRLPPGCKAILTSRRRIGSSADTLILEKLDQAAALETLADLARRIPLLAKTSEAERIALYTQTGGKPLLLRWVAGQLGRGSCRTFTDALHFLRSCPPDNDPLEFIFGDLVKEFTPDETRVLCALTYFTLPAKVEHLATVAGVAEVLAETALRTLANRSLIVPDTEEKAFVLVPMIADFLRKTKPEVIEATGGRLEDRAHTLIVKSGYQKHERFPVLDAAWPTVAAALPLFLAGRNPRLQTVCTALEDFLDFTGRWDEWLSLSQLAEGRAMAEGDGENSLWRAYQAGLVYYRRSQPEELLACAVRAAVHWERTPAGITTRSLVLQLRGRALRLKHDFPAAMIALREALALRRTEATESANLARALGDLASVERLSGDLAAAERDYREALRVSRTVGYDEGCGINTGKLALLALDREKWSVAEELAREALAILETVGRKEVIASNCNRLAIALARQSKAVNGLPYARRAVDLYTDLGAPNLARALETLRECGG